MGVSHLRSSRKRVFGTLGSALVVALAMGCVSRELRELREIRTSYEACVARASDSHPDCLALRDRLDVAERRYGDQARRAWGCDPSAAECPVDR